MKNALKKMFSVLLVTHEQASARCARGSRALREASAGCARGSRALRGALLLALTFGLAGAAGAGVF